MESISTWIASARRWTRAGRPDLRCEFLNANQPYLGGVVAAGQTSANHGSGFVADMARGQSWAAFGGHGPVLSERWCSLRSLYVACGLALQRRTARAVRERAVRFPSKTAPRRVPCGKMQRLGSGQRDCLSQRRARDSNPQPHTGHLSSNEAASQFAYPPL